jgi:hypothetical protein
MKSANLPEHTYHPAKIKITIARLLMVFILILGAQYARSQAIQEIPVVYKNWLILGESRTHLDVTYRIVRCDGINKAELKITSENNVDTVLRCTVNIINLSTGDKVVKEINLPVASFSILSPGCGATNPFPDLAIILPASFDPGNITATIIF